MRPLLTTAGRLAPRPAPQLRLCSRPPPPTHAAGPPGLPLGSRQASPDARGGGGDVVLCSWGAYGATEHHNGPCLGRGRGRAPWQKAGSPPPRLSFLWGSVPESWLSPTWAPAHGDNTAGASFLHPFHRCGISGSVVPGAARLARRWKDLEQVLPLTELPSGSGRAWHSRKGVSEGG